MAAGGTGISALVAYDWTEYTKVPYYWAGWSSSSLFSAVTVSLGAEEVARCNARVLARLQVLLLGSAKGWLCLASLPWRFN